MRTPVGLSKLLNLSPASKREVLAATARGVRSTKQEESPQPNVRNRASRFLDDVARSVAPIVKHVCSLAKFNDQSKPERVMKRVLKRMSMKRKGEKNAGGVGSKRKLTTNESCKKKNHAPPPPKLDETTDSFLSEMAEAWREARRNNDRDGAARILQIVIKAIPKATGT